MLPPKPGVHEAVNGPRPLRKLYEPGPQDDDLPPTIGHNSAPFDEAPNEPVAWVYIVPMLTYAREDLMGEIEALDLEDARRAVRVKLMLPRLPMGTVIRLRAELEAEEKDRKSKTLRFLLRALSEHHQWLQGEGGERADLSGLDLRSVNLRKRNLSHANMGNADLEGADLSGSNLSGANMTRANLRDADLAQADLRNVDLSDANLQGADLTKSDLRGVDLYRANLKGCTIEPAALHRLMDCAVPGED